MNGPDLARFPAPAKKSRQPVDRPDDGQIRQAWLDGKAACHSGLRATSNPHRDWWLGTAWAEGWGGLECSLVVRERP